MCVPKKANINSSSSKAVSTISNEDKRVLKKNDDSVDKDVQTVSHAPDPKPCTDDNPTTAITQPSEDSLKKSKKGVVVHVPDQSPIVPKSPFSTSPPKQGSQRMNNTNVNKNNGGKCITVKRKKSSFFNRFRGQPVNNEHGQVSQETNTQTTAETNTVTQEKLAEQPKKQTFVDKLLMRKRVSGDTKKKEGGNIQTRKEIPPPLPPALPPPPPPPQPTPPALSPIPPISTARRKKSPDGSNKGPLRKNGSKQPIEKTQSHELTAQDTPFADKKTDEAGKEGEEDEEHEEGTLDHVDSLPCDNSVKSKKKSKEKHSKERSRERIGEKKDKSKERGKGKMGKSKERITKTKC